MNKTIWKFDLKPVPGTALIRVYMPPGAVPLTAAEQYDEICVWAEVDSDKSDDADQYFFEVFGTGHSIPEDMGIERKYLGTAFLHGGALVFHVYQRIS